jgi:general secretion pathway protein A
LTNRRGAALLAGESGLGKTLLVQKLLADLDASFAPRAHVVFPQMPADQLLTYLADQLTGQHSPLTATIGQHAIIVIDEAHLLRDLQSLEAIRLLMNFQHDAQPVATFLLAGQTGLVLAARRLPALDERIAVNCVLARLSAAETGHYIQHRLTAAGAKRTIFEPPAIETIHELTHGIPRRINRLCDLALLVGYGEELRTLTSQHIESIHQELIGVAAGRPAFCSTPPRGVRPPPAPPPRVRRVGQARRERRPTRKPVGYASA